MEWVTRARPKTDRIACPWLIEKFIDPDARFAYVPPDDVLAYAARTGARSFDAPGAEFIHRDGKCTFEVLIDEFGLAKDDRALELLARIVHAADIAGEQDVHPFGPALEAIGVGGLDAEPDDATLLARGSFVYDALYAWCARQS